jgi:hypothetical protein
MQKNYICVQYWTDKATGGRVSKFSKFTEAISKENKPYGNIDENVFELVDGGEYRIGAIAAFSTTMTLPETPAKPAPEARNMKINTN